MESFVKARGIGRIGCAAALSLGVVGFASLCAEAAAPAKETLTVITGYPAPVTSVYQRAFELAHPDISVTIIKKSGPEAYKLLAAPGHGGADVYWAASRNFHKLSKLDAFTLLKVDRKALPGRLGSQQLSDPDGRFEAFEIAGYGLAYGPKALWRGKAPPARWSDAAAADLQGGVLMPVAADVGFAPALYEIILQGQGWTKGWALLSEISGNATLTRTPPDLDAIEDGRAGLGLTIDFQPFNAEAKGQPIGFAYPEKTGFLPAYVAELAQAPHPQAAKTFIDFLLSQQGQRMLLTPGISRHPIRPDAYPAFAAENNPFKLLAARLIDFDPVLANARRGLDAALFDSAVVAPHAQLVALWHAIHSAEKQLAAHLDTTEMQKVAQARRLAGFVPITEAQARDPKFLAQLGGNEAMIPAVLRAKWEKEISDARTKTLALLAGFSVK